MNFAKIFTSMLALTMVSLPIDGQALVANAPNTEITIYNQNLALIKKSQTLSLKKGVNQIVFDEVARQMRPESAFIFGKDVKILEQNYDYAGVNYMNMLNAYVGKNVKTVRVNEKTGENVFEKAKLIAVDGATPVLQFDYGIETNFPGRVLFDKVPLGLNSTPVLKAKAEVDTHGDKNLYLAYLTSGFSWEANYVAKVNDDKTLELLGRVSLNNNSGSSYDNVNVNLIAGDVNTVSRVIMPRMAMMKSVNFAATDSMAEAAVISSPEALGGYYMYQIPQPTSLKDGQIKQVSFVNAPQVSYSREGKIVSLLSFGEDKTSFEDVNPDFVCSFHNLKEDGLGIPLPGGKISFYDYDKNNALQFIGENSLSNKAEGQKIELNLGKFFDIYASGEVSNIQKINERKYKKNATDTCITVEQTSLFDVVYKVVNKGKYATSIVLKQPLSSEAKIIQESIKGQMEKGNMYVWKFSVDAGKTVELKVNLQNTYNKRDCTLITLE